MANSAHLSTYVTLSCVLFYSHIVDKMRDSSTGIKLTLNVEQGNRYKETFTGKPAASPLTCCRDKGDTASLSRWDQLWPS